MAFERLFVDTSGFYAFLNVRDEAHDDSFRIFTDRARKTVLLTTEYVVVETATLLRTRGRPLLEQKFFALFDSTVRLRIIWSSMAFFVRTREFFLKHQDHGWSFTDCASFVLMREEGIKDALSTDKHFKQAGFVPLLK